MEPRCPQASYRRAYFRDPDHWSEYMETVKLEAGKIIIFFLSPKQHDAGIVDNKNLVSLHPIFRKAILFPFFIFFAEWIRAASE